jgi:hypothetical protein
MWSLAESGNDQAILEFQARYPEHHHELIRRLNMVHQLKANRPPHPTANPIPTFHLREPAHRNHRPTAVFAMVGMCALALGAIGYTVTSFLERPALHLAPPREVDLRPLPDQSLTRATPSGPQPVQQNANTPQQVQPTNDPSQQAPVPEAPKPKWDIPQELVVKKAPLHTVLNMVAMQGGLKLEIAPNTPNPEIATDYHDMNAVEILKDMGKTYSFTPFLAEDDHSVLIIPAVGPSGDQPTADIDPKHRIGT